MSVTPGALVPLTQTFVQSGTTTAIALVGQVLDNGKTNFVGYDQGSAGYLFTTSEANAKETTLGDHMTYWVSEGKAPGGYLYLTGSATASNDASSSMQTGQTEASTTGGSDSSSTAAVTSQLPLDTGSSQSSGATPTSSGTAAASSTKGNSAQKLSAGAYLSVALGLLSVLSL